MSLARIAWSTVVVICAVACLVSFAAGYSGYGWILIAVGLSAAVNLLPDQGDDPGNVEGPPA